MSIHFVVAVFYVLFVVLFGVAASDADVFAGVVMFELSVVAAYLLVGFAVGYGSMFHRGTGYREEPPRVFSVLCAIIWPVALLGFLAVKICRRLSSLNIYWHVAQLFRRKVHEDDFGVLYSAPSPFGEIRFVRVQDSTGVYWLTVPRNIHRAKQAVAWTYNTDEEDFNPVRV